MEVFSSVTCTLILLLFTLPVTKGHGMMIEPAMRSSLWRFNYPGAEPNYNDNGVNCGGFTNQHERQNGRCGVCGDPFQGPRDNEAGGKYAKGIIARTYKSGQYIKVVSDITANHGGYIELRLCPHDNPMVPVTQQCLNQYMLQIKGDGSRHYLTTNQKSDFKIRHTVKLPDFVTCRQCVLQWYWKAGQHSGINPMTRQECKGCGKQEQFINCADIAITDEFGMFPSVTTVPHYQITTPNPMYDTFMFQSQGMFPEYFDEFNPFITTPSYFNPFSQRFMNNRRNFGQNNNRFLDNRRNTGRSNGQFVNRNYRGPVRNGYLQAPTINPMRRNMQNNRGFQRDSFRNSRPQGNMFNRNKVSPEFRNQRRPYKNRRPLISRNNRPHVNIYANIDPQRNQMKTKANAIRNIRPIQNIPSKIPTTDDSEPDNLEEMIDDDHFLRNSAFWSDFNRLINMSSPDTKQALYEIAEDADDIEEFHRNVQLMLQMQTAVPETQASLDTKSESDESLDIDWLLAQAKDIELDSDEQSLLGLMKGGSRESEENEDNEEDLANYKYISKGHIQKHDYFPDENRILDDSDSGDLHDSDNDDRYSDKSVDRSIESENFDYTDVTDESSDLAHADLEKDYDSDDTDNEMKIDNHMTNIDSDTKKHLPNQQKHKESLEREIKLFPVEINPWNENSLYRTDNIDYDDKDADIEGDKAKPYNHLPFDSQHTTQSVTFMNTVPRDKIEVNYFQSDTRDYSDSEVEQEGYNIGEVEKKWDDTPEEKEKNDFDDDSWSLDTVPDVTASTVVVTGRRSSVSRKKMEDEVEINDEPNSLINSKGENNDENTDKSSHLDEKQKGPKISKKSSKEGDEENAIDDIQGENSNKEISDNTIMQNENKESIMSEISADANNKMDDAPNIKTGEDFKSPMLKGADDIVETTNNEIGFQQQYAVDDVTSPPMDIIETGFQLRPSHIDDASKLGQNAGDLKSYTGLDYTYSSVPAHISNRFSSAMGSRRRGVYPQRSQLVRHQTLSGPMQVNQPQVPKPNLSVFRQKIQDTIYKSMNQNENGGIPTITKLMPSSKGSKKELSPSLSKLVLKMFMNTKSSAETCSEPQQSVCTPVTLWSKYQQIADWCTSLCQYGNCPSAVCTCNCKAPSNSVEQKVCRAQSTYKKQSGELDQWCQKSCSAGDCPELLCVCS
ncbi:unnamed protein product [Mytilus coruscus]|uniref:Chitin-binding type-4 domain-containing protein n=1 Tax=Mytilus coruscus TaxID=42192 RepID=A0A6J8CWL4_MYTCO|nr:unnamed protein product [Mytilus coruscus]